MVAAKTNSHKFEQIVFLIGWDQGWLMIEDAKQLEAERFTDICQRRKFLNFIRIQLYYTFFHSLSEGSGNT